MTYRIWGYRWKTRRRASASSEFEDYFGMGQSKISYHMKKLKDAGLVREERRGKWSFYSLDREAAGELLGEAADRLLSGPEKPMVVGSGCC